MSNLQNVKGNKTLDNHLIKSVCLKYFCDRMIKLRQGCGFDLCRGQLALFYCAAKGFIGNVFILLDMAVLHMGGSMPKCCLVREIH